MHPSILAKRKASAIDRILTASRSLADLLNLDPALTEALQPKGVKDPAAVEMMRLEALADLLDQFIVYADVPGRVTAVTEGPPVVPFSEGVNPRLDELPPPVLEENAPLPQSQEVPADESAPEEEIAEEAPAPTPKKSSKRSKKKSMTFTYNLAASDETLLNISKVRLELGDTNVNAGVRPDGSNLTDEEIRVWLDEEANDVMQTVARAAAALSKMWTNVANLTVGPRREELGAVAKQWADRAKESTGSTGVNYAGKIVGVDHKHDPYRYRPEDSAGM